MSIGDRIKQWRGDKNLKQDQASSLLGIKFSTYQKYEMDISKPGADALESFANAGINVNWLLTGQGPMLLADLAAKSQAPEPSSPVNYELLQSLIEMLERILKERRLVLEPARKAAAIQIMYEYCMLDEKAASPATVEKFLKLVA